jgi:hypothetical protein
MGKKRDLVRTKRNMQEDVIIFIMDTFSISEKQAMLLWFKSKTYSWFIDDRYGIAREGVGAICDRIRNEIAAGVTADNLDVVIKV